MFFSTQGRLAAPPGWRARQTYDTMTRSMDAQPIEQTSLFGRLPPEWPEDLLPAIQTQAAASQRKVIVLDDDPTGTQTVHSVPVLTGWPIERLAEELRGASPAIYLLTNSRGLPAPEAQALNAETGARLVEARRRTGQDFVVVSRSDSTLRGHFPQELEALAAGLGQPFDAWLVVPFFVEGGRFTVGDVHYVAEGQWLTPAGQTEFARDQAFGYRSSNLREWVAEKTGGRVQAAEVASISLDVLRQEGPGAIARLLLNLPRGAICFCNAASYRDLEVLVAGLLEAEAAGKRYLYRTAASFVRVRAGIAPRPLLTRADLALPEQGAGLVVAGSYVPRTTAQLEALFNQTGIAPLEVRVERLLDETGRAGEIERVRKEANRLLAAGRDAAVYTSRRLAGAGSPERSLAIGQTVSDSMVAIVRGLETRPRYLLAKGGITSSDVATRGLGIQRAWVLGQILPGVPVWQSGPESRYTGLSYVVFPGNVGEPGALATIVSALAG
jgi:uncharacterized protein YgbK (DUF1537 family)